MAEKGTLMDKTLPNTCTCISVLGVSSFPTKGIFSDVLSDKMAEWGMMRHQGLRS